MVTGVIKGAITEIWCSFLVVLFPVAVLSDRCTLPVFSRRLECREVSSMPVRKLVDDTASHPQCSSGISSYLTASPHA